MKHYHAIKLLTRVLLISCCQIHVHGANNKRKHVTGNTYSKTFKKWTHDEENASVDLDMIAGYKQSRRQRYAALGRASFFFIDKRGVKKCSSSMVPEGTATHIAYHFPELEETFRDFGHKGAKAQAPTITVQEHLIIEEFMNDDYVPADGSYPIEEFKILHQSGTIHHETEGGGSIEVCVTFDDADAFPVLVALDITTGREHHTDYKQSQSEVESELEFYMDQIEKAENNLHQIVSASKSIKRFEAEFRSASNKMHKTSLRWPVIQIVVLFVAGIGWCYSIHQYLKEKHF
eukprot:CAMPEP_0194275292 /NCGR_PEP_ID=MMETSP0169-20130528/8170_1 /TAXON_ID=218684 /ORGANISM="Corethron pennatum, Strain L29A3" /LENGTH=289 /DNA_ID=CAMNT_0039018717 /DNA_START=37 /DNA_END=906 /DNA_ORIENTATION=-